MNTKTILFPEGSGHLQGCSPAGPTLAYGHTAPTPTQKTARRRRVTTPVQRSAANVREKKRMCSLNVAFDNLRKVG